MPFFVKLSHTILCLFSFHYHHGLFLISNMRPMLYWLLGEFLDNLIKYLSLFNCFQHLKNTHKLLKCSVWGKRSVILFLISVFCWISVFCYLELFSTKMQQLCCQASIDQWINPVLHNGPALFPSHLPFSMVSGIGDILVSACLFGPTLVCTPNWLAISWAVFAQLTCASNMQTQIPCYIRHLYFCSNRSHLELHAVLVMQPTHTHTPV